MKKLVTFIGTGDYKEVSYQYGEHHCVTNIAPIALIKWFHPEEVIILLTDLASQNKNWHDLEEYLKSNSVTYHSVPIPDGKSEHEIWQLFSIIAEKLSEDDEIILDITHGFRSLPFLALLAAI